MKNQSKKPKNKQINISCLKLTKKIDQFEKKIIKIIFNCILLNDQQIQKRIYNLQLYCKNNMI